MKKKREMTQEQFNKWRLYVEYIKHAETKKELMEHKGRVKELEIQNMVLRANIFRSQITQSADNVDAVKREYDTIKEELETDLGFSITNCVVDEVSLEVKDIEI